MNLMLGKQKWLYSNMLAFIQYVYLSGNKQEYQQNYFQIVIEPS